MQPEERHELKQNDLQEFLANFGEFWKKSGNSILILITIAVVIFAGYRIYSTRMESRYENTWADVALTSSPASFADLAESLPFPAARAKAALNGADLYLQEALAPGRAAAGEPSAEEKLARAQALYQAALDEDVHEVMHLNALLGLAEITLAREQFDAAAEQFAALVARAGDAYPVHTGIAQQRLDAMDRLRNPVPLAADPPPTVEVTDAPFPPMMGEVGAGVDSGTDADAPTPTPAPADEADTESEAEADAEPAPAEQAE